MKTRIFVAITIAALGAVGITTAIMMGVTAAHAIGSGEEQHVNKGSGGCTGPGSPCYPNNDICNRGTGCHIIGPN